MFAGRAVPIGWLHRHPIGNDMADMATFDRTFRDTSGARNFVRSALSGVSQPVIADAVLLTSELVTNALLHASDAAEVHLNLDNERLRVEVADPDGLTDLFALQVGVTSEHGRGLAIVNALASAWGVESRPVGKAVWFELRIHGTAQA